jgi:hypothetical protein
MHALLKLAHGLLELAETIFKLSVNPILRISWLDGHDTILLPATRASTEQGADRLTPPMRLMFPHGNNESRE